MPPSTSTNASEYGALKSGDEAVVSSQTYLFRERWMMKKKTDDNLIPRVEILSTSVVVVVLVVAAVVNTT